MHKIFDKIFGLILEFAVILQDDFGTQRVLHAETQRRRLFHAETRRRGLSAGRLETQSICRTVGGAVILQDV